MSPSRLYDNPDPTMNEQTRHQLTSQSATQHADVNSSHSAYAESQLVSTAMPRREYEELLDGVRDIKIRQQYKVQERRNKKERYVNEYESKLCSACVCIYKTHAGREASEFVNINGSDDVTKAADTSLSESSSTSSHRPMDLLSTFCSSWKSSSSAVECTVPDWAHVECLEYGAGGMVSMSMSWKCPCQQGTRRISGIKRLSSSLGSSFEESSPSLPAHYDDHLSNFIREKKCDSKAVAVRMLANLDEIRKRAQKELDVDAVERDALVDRQMMLSSVMGLQPDVRIRSASAEMRYRSRTKTFHARSRSVSIRRIRVNKTGSGILQDASCCQCRNDNTANMKDNLCVCRTDTNHVMTSTPNNIGAFNGSALGVKLAEQSNGAGVQTSTGNDQL